MASGETSDFDRGIEAAARDLEERAAKWEAGDKGQSREFRTPVRLLRSAAASVRLLKRGAQ